MGDSYIANIRERLKRNEEEHILLVAAMESAEALTRFDGAEQLSMNIDPPSNGAIGKMGFSKGVGAVLRGADGASLDSAEIWKRMQKLGVQSNAKRPESFVIWHAKKHPEEIEALGNKTFRWIGG